MQHSQHSGKQNDVHYECISLLDSSSVQQYKVSLNSSSNLTSSTLLKETWQINSELLHDNSVNQILGSATELLQNADSSNVRTWKSSISKFTDPVAFIKKSLPPCEKCESSKNYVGLKAFLRNECKCDIDNAENNSRIVNNSNTSTSKYLQSDESSQESKSGDEHKLYKPSFSKKIIQKSNILTKSDVTQNPNREIEYNSNMKEFDVAKEEEDNKAHKSNVAKITFRSAREQLLATNPAAKRTLGASRKAQCKFVSPMIGAQDKQESSQAPEETDERLKHIDPKMIELIESEIIDKGTPIEWEDIAGLQLAKSVIQEAVVWPLLRPDIFTGLRRPPKGILLFGPPGTGKTLIGRCVAAQCRATFFSISASSLTSKWLGDGEKMVRALFAVARRRQPAVVFIDEIDSLLTQRSNSEHEATRRIKTEFLVQFDGAATEEEDRLLIIGATNRPHELDEAARRRLVKRLYIPLPDVQARGQIIANLLQNEQNDLTPQHVSEIANLTDGYSGADMKSLCSEAAMGPIRSVPLSQIISINRDKVRPVCLQDFINALQRVRPSVSQDDLGQYVKWNKTYGQGF